MTLPLSFHNRRIALLDDDEIFSSLITEYAKEKGISVDHFASVFHLSDHRAMERYDAVLVDVHFGQYNGFEVAQAVRQKFGDIPILMISADKKPNAEKNSFITKQEGFESILSHAIEAREAPQNQCQP